MATWMNLEDIMLHEVAFSVLKTQKEKYCMFSLISGM